MTYATAINVSPRVTVHMTLLFDGIPILFGTRAGLIHPGTGVTNPGDLISVSGLVAESLSLGSAKLDVDKSFVTPSRGSASIRIDAAWNRYFESRRTPLARLTTFLSEDPSDPVEVNSTVGFDAPDVIYINREAMLIDTVDSDTQFTVIRNYNALPINAAAVHQVGSVVSRQPIGLLGRMAELRVWPSTDPADSRIVKYFCLAGSPEYDLSSGCWRFDFDDNARLLDRPICVGFKGAKILDTAYDLDGTGANVQTLFTLTPEGIVPPDQHREFLDHSTDLGHIAVDHDGVGFFAKFYNLSATTGRENQPSVLLEGSARFPSANDDGGNNGVWTEDGGAPTGHDDINDGKWGMRRCCIFTGPPMVAALQVMLSDKGNGLNHATYDVLYGVSATGFGSDGRLEAGESECRMGAAIPAALIEIPSTEILNKLVPGWRRILLEEENLLNFLNDVAYALNGAWHQNIDGIVSFKVYESDYASDTYAATLTRSDILIPDTPLVSIDDETNCVHTVKIRCNWDPFSKDFKGDVVIWDEETRQTYRDISGTLKIERKGLIVDLPGQALDQVARGAGGSAANVNGLITQADRLFYRRRRVRKYKMALPWKHATLLVGDRVRVTFDKFNDFAGATLSSFAAVVMEVNPDIRKGTLVVEVYELLTASLIAPTSELTGWAAGPPQVMTLAVGSKWGDILATKPGRQYAIGWKLQIFDKSAAVQYATASSVMTVTAVTDTTVTVTGTAGFTPASGDIVTMAQYDDADSAVLNAAQSLSQREYISLADDNFFLGSAFAAGYVWG